MSTTQKYSDIYSENFKDYFGNHKEVLTEIELNTDEYSINVDKIIEKLGISVEETFLTHIQVNMTLTITRCT